MNKTVGTIIAFTALVNFFTACNKHKQTHLLELLPAEHTGIDFSNQLTEDEQLNILSFEYFYNGAGVATGDFNNDGLKDIFFTANMVSNRLYLNKGDLRFEDITERAGLISSRKWATGVSLVDINQDGWLDIYVCYAGPFAAPEKRANELYINNGDNTFSEQAKQYGLDDTGHTVQAAFFDYDLDGDLDVYLLTNITDETGPNVIRPKRVKGEMVNTDRLYRNNGDGTFTNISQQAGITIEGYGLGVSITDINQDGFPDIYVSNDYLSNDLLYINNRNGTFTDRASMCFKHTSYSAMGNDVADFNNDGLNDIIAVDMLPPDNKRQKLMFGSTNYDRYRSEIQYGYAPQFMRNTLQLNRSNDSTLLFSEIGQLAGIAATDWSWSALFADIDNDGWKDLIVTNGYPKDITNRDFASYKANEFIRAGHNEPVMKNLVKALSSLEGAYLTPFAFRNKGDLTFSDESSAWGFTQPSYSTGAAYADLDNDGDLDLVINNTNSKAFIYKNTSETKKENHFLNIRLNGPKGNSHGFGTKMWLYQKNFTQYFEQSPYRGFQSTVDMDIHAGLGNSLAADSLVIQWPDGKQQRMKNVPANQFLKINYSDASTAVPSVKKRSTPYFQAAEKKYSTDYVHRETHYVDFKIQPLLPHKNSQDGPGIAVGDVNGDGLEDFFVGGAYKQQGEFFLQKKNGAFQRKPISEETKYEEDAGALLFDADNDGDLDLYLVSGGNEFEMASPYYQDRLYFNDGRGNFSIHKNALPMTTASGSCVLASDYDRDGDLDLFVGGRHLPQHYPFPPENYLLRNDGGIFSDVTMEIAPGLKDIGMVTAGLWTDFNNDGKTDLIIAGEWMPVTFFENRNERLLLLKEALPKSGGWWNSITASDFDQDGDTDYILGNLGLNSRYRASPAEPVRIFSDDLNRDGTQDPIIAQYIQGVNRPAHPREDLLLQVTSFKKKYPSYSSYAEATIEDVLGKEAKPTIWQSQLFSSVCLRNDGNGSWQIKPLPAEAQFAPLYGMVTGEFTGDDHEDIVLAGNSYAPDVLTGRYDAFKGLLLKGDSMGNFQPLSIQESGILIDGDAKGLAILRTATNRQLILATQNNDTLRATENILSQNRVLIASPNDAYAIVTHGNGKKSKHEFYYGSGYLSQSSRCLWLPETAVSVMMFTYDGHSREIPRTVLNKSFN